MPFTELKELITIVTNKGIPDTVALGLASIDKQEPRFKLFDGVRQDTYTSHEEAALDIYGGKPGDNNFKLLKSRLKQQLMQAIIEYDVTRDKGMSAQQRAVYDTVRGVYEVRTLMTNGALHVSRNQAERLLSMAMKHDVTEPAMQLSRMLRSLYAYMGDAKKAHTYELIHQNYLQRFHAEDRSEELVDSIALLYSTTTDDLHAHRAQLDAVRSEIIELQKQQPTFLVTTNFYRVQTLTAHIKGEHLQAASHAVDAISYLEEHPEFVSRNRIAEFATIAMSEFFSLGDFVEAQKLADRCFENYVPLSNQWYNFLSLYFVLVVHSADYKKSMGIFRKAAVSALSVQPKSNQERWKLYAGYLLYLHEAEFVRFTKSELDLLRKNFDRKKFSFAFNYDLEVYARDKTGMRISVLILELLFSIEDGRLQDILSLQEKLRLIYYRVLKADVYPRANSFFHLIQILMQEDFNVEKTRRRSHADLAILNPHTATPPKKSKKIAPSASMEGLEILRYETLWEMMLTRIEQLQRSGKLN